VRCSSQVAQVGEQFHTPSRKVIGGDKMIKDERRRVEADVARLHAFMPPDAGFTLTSDGATTNTYKPVLNLLAIKCGVVEYISAKDCSGSVKNMQYIAALETITPPHTGNGPAYPGQMIHLQNLGLPGPKSFRAEYWRPTWSGAHADECNARASTRAFQRYPGLPLSVR
jgi:hypothetical protein